MEHAVKPVTMEQTVKMLLSSVDQYVLIRRLLGKEDVGVEQQVVLNGINTLKRKYDEARKHGDETTMNEKLIQLTRVLTRFIPTIVIPHTDALHHQLSGR